MKASVYMSAVRKQKRRICMAYGKKRKRLAADLAVFISRYQASAMEDWYANMERR